MIDIHAHVLPAIDDGPPGWEESLALCRRLAADGVTTAVATPHVIDGVYRNTRASVAAAVDELTRRLAAAGVALAVVPGGEVDMTCLRLTQPPYDDIPTLNGTRYVLIEIPAALLPRSLPGLLFSLTSRGTIPVIAHPERNHALQRDPGLAEQWRETGCSLQIDAESVLGLWGAAAEACARRLVGAGLAHALASDAHSCERRPPRLRAATAVVAEWAGPAMAEYLIRQGPERLLGGQSPGRPPVVRAAAPERRTWRQRLGLGA